MSTFKVAFGLSSTFVLSWIFIGMVIAGAKFRRFKVEPQSPPIVLRERPCTFIGLLLLFTTLAILSVCTFFKFASLAL